MTTSFLTRKDDGQVFPTDFKAKKAERLRKRIETLSRQLETEKDRVDRPYVKELELYAENDSQLYHSQGYPIQQNLEKKKRKGTYDSLAAVILYKHYADNIAKKYAKDFGATIVSPATRRALAVQLAENFERQYADEHQGEPFDSIGAKIRAENARMPEEIRRVMEK